MTLLELLNKHPEGIGRNRARRSLHLSAKALETEWRRLIASGVAVERTARTAGRSETLLVATDVEPIPTGADADGEGTRGTVVLPVPEPEKGLDRQADRGSGIVGSGAGNAQKRPPKNGGNTPKLVALARREAEIMVAEDAALYARPPRTAAPGKLTHEMPEQGEAVRTKPPKMSRPQKPPAIEDPQSAVHEADPPEVEEVTAQPESDRCPVCERDAAKVGHDMAIHDA